MADNNMHILCEQGDLGLWDTPVTDQEQKLLNEQAKKETENNNEKK